MQISAYNTAKERLAKQASHEEVPLSSADIPHLYKDKSVDLETGETKPDSENKSHSDARTTKEASDETPSKKDEVNGHMSNKNGHKTNEALHNGHDISSEGTESSSLEAKTKPDDQASKGNIIVTKYSFDLAAFASYSCRFELFLIFLKLR